VWRRERVKRTSTVVEAGAEKEQMRDVDPAAVGEAVGVASRWTRRRSGRAAWTRQWSGRQSVRRRGSHGGGAGAGVDPTVVGEAVSEAST
jgi:hypothetical protein